MAKYEFRTHTSINEIKSILEKELESTIQILIKNSSIIIRKNMLITIVYHVTQVSEKTICSGPHHYFPSILLAMLSVCIVTVFLALLLGPIAIVGIIPVFFYKSIILPLKSKVDIILKKVAVKKLSLLERLP